MLKFVYSDNALLVMNKNDCIFDELVDLAALYDFPLLATASEALGIKLLQNTICPAVLVVGMTITAYQWNIKNLKNACIAYIKTKGPMITMAPSFWAMNSSHPEVWMSLRKDLGVPVDIDIDQGTTTERVPRVPTLPRVPLFSLPQETPRPRPPLPPRVLTFPIHHKPHPHQITLVLTPCSHE
jgi:hypothetical protein